MFRFVFLQFHQRPVERFAIRTARFTIANNTAITAMRARAHHIAATASANE